MLEPYNPFSNRTEVEDYTVGAAECAASHGKCNGKLKPGTIYRFKVISSVPAAELALRHYRHLALQTLPSNHVIPPWSR